MIATWLKYFDISKVDKKNWTFRPNIIFLERRQVCNFSSWLATFVERTQFQSVLKKFNENFPSNETLFSDCPGKGFEIPAHEENRTFKVKSVVGFWRDSLLNIVVIQVTCT